MLWPLSCITDATQGYPVSTSVQLTRRHVLWFPSCCHKLECLLLAYSTRRRQTGKIVSLCPHEHKRKKWYWDIDAVIAERAEGGGTRWCPRPRGLLNHQEPCRRRSACTRPRHGAHPPTRSTAAAYPISCTTLTCCTCMTPFDRFLYHYSHFTSLLYSCHIFFKCQLIIVDC